MARPLRIQFPGALYHVTSRGNAQADIVRDDGDRLRWRDGLRATVVRHGWQLLSYVLMDNHFHLFVRTPEPNLSKGMQRFLSGYATWFARRLGRRGHVFQGRFDAQLVEGESYFWNVSRYVHLNPVRAGMAARASDWPWSSFRAFADPSIDAPWIATDAILRAWQGEFGGSPDDARRSYVQFVDASDAASIQSPFLDAVDGWILGGATFVDRVRLLAAAERESADSEMPDEVQLRMLDVEDVLQCVATQWRLRPGDLTSRRHAAARFVFAQIATQRTDATLSEIAVRLGLARGQSVSAMLWRTRRQSRATALAELAESLACGLERRRRGQIDTSLAEVTNESI